MPVINSIILLFGLRRELIITLGVDGYGSMRCQQNGDWVEGDERVGRDSDRSSIVAGRYEIYYHVH